MRRFPSRVTFQEPTTVRTPSGGVTPSYANIAALTDLPARVIPAVEEDDTERMTLTSDLWDIIVQGDRDISVDMAALSGGIRYDVVRVARPTQQRQRILATIVRATRIKP